MSAPSTSGLSVELLLRVIDVKYGYFTLCQTIAGYESCYTTDSNRRLQLLCLDLLMSLVAPCRSWTTKSNCKVPRQVRTVFHDVFRYIVFRLCFWQL